MNPRENRFIPGFSGRAGLFCLATYISRFNPLEVLWNRRILEISVQDFLPPRFNASPVVE